jgi:hypothetical protein
MGAADLFEQWRRDVGFADHPWGRVALPEAGNNGSDGPVCMPSRAAGSTVRSSPVASTA